MDARPNTLVDQLEAQLAKVREAKDTALVLADAVVTVRQEAKASFARTGDLLRLIDRLAEALETEKAERATFAALAAQHVAEEEARAAQEAAKRADAAQELYTKTHAQAA